MPIELPEPSSDKERPTPLNPIVWLVLLLGCLAGGVAWTLLTWPKGQPTGTPWFWMRLLGYPTLAWAALFGIRLHFHEEDSNHLAAREEIRQADRDEAIAFGTEPLAVLGAVYLCAMGTDGVSGRISQKEAALQARTLERRVPAVRHTRLALGEGGGSIDRYRQTFQALLQAIDAPLRTLPPRVPFDVQLQLPGEADPESLLTVWKTCWHGCDLRSAEATLVPASEGLMMLDTWLDEYGGPALEKFTLFIAVQLHDRPPENSGEAAAALLLGWAPLAERRDLAPVAMLHRPVACEADGIAEAMTTAALCGRAKPEDLPHLWQSGLSRSDKAALLKVGAEVALGAAREDALPGVHDIDTAIGNPGAAAGWFATALAIEQAQQTRSPQLIACREHALRLAVVRPVAHLSRTETT
ncbi:hypothetical protein [Cupriavidus sp. TMH.W2]|uniref:hypothetical protein n=1 Tax=Cupriavidus sp. TMH.W2 TaxID=3434465 RepID=UPI003D771A34